MNKIIIADEDYIDYEVYMWQRLPKTLICGYFNCF